MKRPFSFAAVGRGGKRLGAPSKDAVRAHHEAHALRRPDGSSSLIAAGANADRSEEWDAGSDVDEVEDF